MWHHCIKMEFQKITNFLDSTPDDKDLQDLLLKIGSKSIINQEETTMLMKKLELKRQS